MRGKSGECAGPPARAESRGRSNSAREGARVGGAGRGAGPTGRLRRHTRPQIPGRASQERRRAELSKARGTSGLTMTLLPASNASAAPRTGRPPALGAGSPTRLRSPAEGKRFRARRGSRSHSQPCGSRTRRSCCTLSQDRPIVLARSRRLSPGSARPGRCWPSAPWLAPAPEAVLRRARHGGAKKTGSAGLLGPESFALWFEATVKLLSSAHQGGRHVANTQHASRSTA